MARPSSRTGAACQRPRAYPTSAREPHALTVSTRHGAGVTIYHAVVTTLRQTSTHGYRRLATRKAFRGLVLDERSISLAPRPACPSISRCAPPSANTSSGAGSTPKGGDEEAPVLPSVLGKSLCRPAVASASSRRASRHALTGGQAVWHNLQVPTHDMSIQRVRDL